MIYHLDGNTKQHLVYQVYIHCQAGFVATGHRVSHKS